MAASSSKDPWWQTAFSEVCSPSRHFIRAALKTFSHLCTQMSRHFIPLKHLKKCKLGLCKCCKFPVKGLYLHFLVDIVFFRSFHTGYINRTESSSSSDRLTMSMGDTITIIRQSMIVRAQWLEQRMYGRKKLMSV